MIELITTQTKLSKADIKVTGNPAYIAPGSPTTGKKVIIDVLVPASPKDTGAKFYNASNMDQPDIAQLLYD